MLADDMLKGLRAISDFTGFTERELREFARLKTLPMFKIGKLHLARKSELDRAMSGVAAER